MHFYLTLFQFFKQIPAETVSLNRSLMAASIPALPFGDTEYGAQAEHLGIPTQANLMEAAPSLKKECQPQKLSQKPV
jgi:hypothetical protein